MGPFVAGAAGLEPGDVVKSVDGAEVHAIGGLAGLEPRTPQAHWFEVQRGRRTVKLQLGEPPLEAPAPTAAVAGLTLGTGKTAGSVVVLAVGPDSAAGHAGILAGDVLRRVGAASIADPEAAASALQRLKGPAVLALARDGKEFEVLLEP